MSLIKYVTINDPDMSSLQVVYPRKIFDDEYSLLIRFKFICGRNQLRDQQARTLFESWKEDKEVTC